LASPSGQEIIRPKDRTLLIRSQIERELARQKERDHSWDDQVDVSSVLHVPSQFLINYLYRTCTSLFQSLTRNDFSNIFLLPDPLRGQQHHPIQQMTTTPPYRERRAPCVCDMDVVVGYWSIEGRRRHDPTLYCRIVGRAHQIRTKTRPRKETGDYRIDGSLTWMMDRRLDLKGPTSRIECLSMITTRRSFATQ
jgi:hypothetical protein